MRSSRLRVSTDTRKTGNGSGFDAKFAKGAKFRHGILGETLRFSFANFASRLLTMLAVRVLYPTLGSNEAIP